MSDILLTEAEVLSAIRLLFAFDGRIGASLLQSIEYAQVKKAYRKKALETHPDRFPDCGARFGVDCSRRFIEVTRAYETLNSYLDLRSRGFSFPRPEVVIRPRSGRSQPFKKRDSGPSTSGHTGSEGPASRPSSGPSWYGLPPRPLRIGEFLYHSGIVSWRSLVSALVWQRRQRPRLGEIAQKWRWLTEDEVMALLDKRRAGERLGELLLRYNFINSFQLNVLLWHQKKLQKPIGHYFIDQGLVTEAEIRRHLMRLHFHNQQSRPDFGYRARRT